MGKKKDKHTLKVLLTVRPNENCADEIHNFNNDDDKDEGKKGKDLRLYKMDIESHGAYTKKAKWEDIELAFAGTKSPVNADTMKDIIDEYIEKNYPDLKDAENRHPKNVYIKDEPLRGISYYKDYDWEPMKVHLKGYNKVEVHEHWTKSVIIEEFPYDYSTDIQQVLLKQGDKEIISTLKKSKLQGSNLGKLIMTSDSRITTEFRDIDSTTFILGNKEEPDEFDTETGESIWKDVKTLRALLKDKETPKKKGAGITRTLEVIGLESYMKARVFYSSYVKGEIVTDHGINKLKGSRWWNFEFKGLLLMNDIQPTVEVYEDIELHFFTEIKYKMDNKDFVWDKDADGKWIKSYTNQMPRPKITRTKSADETLAAIANASLAEDDCPELTKPAVRSKSGIEEISPRQPPPRGVLRNTSADETWKAMGDALPRRGGRRPGCSDES